MSDRPGTVIIVARPQSSARETDCECGALGLEKREAVEAYHMPPCHANGPICHGRGRRRQDTAHAAGAGS